MCVVRGVISPHRRELIRRAFQQLDVTGDGILLPEQVIERYDPTQHPDVKNGRKRAQEAFRSFLKAFEVGGEVEQKITRNEFLSYYFNVSASVEDDDYFEMIICGVWHLEGFFRNQFSSAQEMRSRERRQNHNANNSYYHDDKDTYNDNHNVDERERRNDQQVYNNNSVRGGSRTPNRANEDSKIEEDEEEVVKNYKKNNGKNFSKPSSNLDYAEYRSNRKSSPSRQYNYDNDSETFQPPNYGNDQNDDNDNQPRQWKSAPSSSKYRN